MAKAAPQDLALFEIALKTISSACGVAPTFILSPAPGKSGANGAAISVVVAGAEATLVVPYEVKGLKTPVGVDTEFFLSAVKFIRKGSLTFSQSSLLLSNGRSESRVNVTDADSIPKIVAPSPDEGTQTFKLTPPMHAFLTTKLPLVKLEKTFAQAPDITLIVKVKGGKAQLVTYEKHQFCIWSGTVEDVPDMDLALPYQRFLALIKDLPVTSCEVTVTSDVILLKSASLRIRLSLPAVDPEETVAPEIAYPRVRELAKSTGAEITLPAADLQSLLEAARSLVSTGTHVKFRPCDRGVDVRVESAKGHTGATFQAKIKKPFALDYRYVQQVLQKNTVKTTVKSKSGEDVTSSTITFAVVQDGALIVSKANCTYIAALGVNETDE